MSTSEGEGRLWAALEHGADALSANPPMAERIAQGILQGLPGQQHALMLLVSARRAQGDTAGARAMLETTAMAAPKLAAVHHELGQLLSELGETDEAIAALTHVVELEPNHPTAWRALGDQLAEAGQTSRAAEAYQRHFESSVNDLRLLESTADFTDEQLPAAEGILRAFLEIYPTDVFATLRLGKICAKIGKSGEAEALFARAAKLAPGSAQARYEYAAQLFRAEKWAEAHDQIEAALERNPPNADHRALKAAILKELAEYQASVECYEAILRDQPAAKVWVAYGHALKIVGRGKDAAAAFRQAIELKPDFGEAWWALSNLKTSRFQSREIDAMRKVLERSDLSAEDRCYLHFALGKGLEDQHSFAESFEEYRSGNALRRAALGHDSKTLHDHMRRSKDLFTREFFESRAGSGCSSREPIFIVGLPRSGSTLVEQILASHSAIEGTMELPDISFIAKQLRSKGHAGYPDVLASLEPPEMISLGEQYLERSRLRRKLDVPFFTDKMPNNIQHLGLIQLILPNAKIIDVRRHPMACGLSLFKQYFASGMSFTCDLGDIGRYYRDYVSLMAHFDAVLPGRVHRVFYEDLVQNPEQEIRKLLDYCGVPFEDSCVTFHQTQRNIRTASAEQVRQPLYTEALDAWRHYEPWLGALKEALGPVLDNYPALPADSSL